MAKSVLSSCGNRVPDDHYLNDLLDGKPFGLFFGSGGYAKEGRKLVVKLLQRFGFFREETMEKIIQSETRELLDKEFFGKIPPGQKTAVLSMHHIFHIYALNVVHQVVLGSRLEAGDPAVRRLLSVIDNFNDSFNSSVLDLFPWLRHVPCLRFHRHLVEFNRFFKEYLQVNRKIIKSFILDFRAMRSPLLSVFNSRRSCLNQRGGPEVTEQIRWILGIFCCLKWIEIWGTIHAI